MGMFSVDENIDDYINHCTLAELVELSKTIAKRKEVVIGRQKQELAVKLKEAFDAYHNIIPFGNDDLTVEIEITDNNGYTTTYSVELAEAIITSQNHVVFKAYDLDLNEY